mgnify:CR=1 FL=1
MSSYSERKLESGLCKCSGCRNQRNEGSQMCGFHQKARQHRQLTVALRVVKKALAEGRVKLKEIIPVTKKSST